MAGAARDAMAANDLLVSSVADLNDAMTGTDPAAASMIGSLHAVADVSRDTRTAIAGASAAAGGLSRSFGNLNDKAFMLSAGLAVLDKELDRKRDALIAAGIASKVFSAAVADLRGPTAGAAAATAAAAGATGMWVGGLRLTGQAIHWLVMGTLEVASTAIPAIVALGAAGLGLYPTFSELYDRMSNLVTASGGLQGALLNSVGPLHQVGVNMGAVSKAMQPDALIIFGSAINDLSGHMGAFSGVAEKAGNVLAAFATKITADLNGPMGSQLTGFFANGVKFMIQWGQVLGNLGHAFLNVVSAMWGVGQILLDVLVELSRAFLALTSNPIAAWFIGVAAAMSAVYRYGLLLSRIWTFLGGTAVVTAIRGIIATFVSLAATMSATDAAVLTFYGVLSTVTDFLMGPVGIAIGAITAGLGIWYLASRSTSDATTQLIKHIESAPPTVQNLTKGIGDLTANLQNLGKTSKFIEGVMPTLIPPEAGDIAKTITAYRRRVMELLNLKAGLAQAGAGTGAVLAGENAIAVQSAITSGKVQALNQALDFYMQIVTGGTGGLAAFSESLQNIGSVAGHVSDNLGQATGQMSLSVGQFANALRSFQGTGAGAWTNFDQILGSTMPQMMDWFRQAATLGATTGQAVSKAALDMASAMVPFAAKSQTAQATLLAFVRAQGLNIKSFPALISAIKTAGANQGDLTKKVEGTTIALSDLSQMAKNVSNILNTQVSTQLANAALASTTFNSKLAKLQADAANGAPWSVLKGDIAGVDGQVATAGQRAITWGNQMAQGSATAAASVQAAAKAMAAAFANAKTQAQLLQSFIDSMHGKNLSVGVSFPIGGGGSINSGPPGGVAPSGPHGPQGPQAIIINHGTILSGQEIGRLVQTVANQKTIRNGSTQMFIRGRLH